MFTFSPSGRRLGTHLRSVSGRLWICVWVKNATRMPISDAAVTAASSSRELLTPRSPTNRTLEDAADGGLTAGSFCGFVCDTKVLNTNDKTSVMSGFKGKPAYKVSRVCLFVCLLIAVRTETCSYAAMFRLTFQINFVLSLSCNFAL